jgi:hypothetical protein
MSGDLVDAVFSKPTSGGRCWRGLVTDDGALAFLRAVEKRMGEGHKPLFTVMARTLQEQFGVDIADCSVARHYKGLCRCPR